MMFNKPDPDRIKLLGPDRACAEWVLRNGGRVVWADGKKTADYNLLPSEAQGVPKISEIDATDSSISHYGFPHLGKFLNNITKSLKVACRIIVHVSSLRPYTRPQNKY